MIQKLILVALLLPALRLPSPIEPTLAPRATDSSCPTVGTIELSYHLAPVENERIAHEPSIAFSACHAPQGIVDHSTIDDPSILLGRCGDKLCTLVYETYVPHKLVLHKKWVRIGKEVRLRFHIRSPFLDLLDRDKSP